MFAVKCILVVCFFLAVLSSPNFFFVGFFVLFSITAVLLGYRVFAYPDDWYQAQADKAQLWYARHPSLTLCLMVLSVLGLLWQVINFARLHF